MLGPYFSNSLPILVCIAPVTVSVETITAIASINPIELAIARPFLLERFFETKVNVRKLYHVLSFYWCSLILDKKM
jgi:hypothetical protein